MDVVEQPGIIVQFFDGTVLTAVIARIVVVIGCRRRRYLSLQRVVFLLQLALAVVYILGVNRKFLHKLPLLFLFLSFSLHIFFQLHYFIGEFLNLSVFFVHLAS